MSTGTFQFDGAPGGSTGLLPALSLWLNSVLVLGLAASLITLLAHAFSQAAAMLRWNRKVTPAVRPGSAPPTLDRSLSSRGKYLYREDARCSSS